MSTIGHPLSDLVNLITPFSLVNKTRIEPLSVFSSAEIKCLPRVEELIKLYAGSTGWDPSPDLKWGIAFSIFRMTAICQGIASRYALRQASSAEAKKAAEARHPAAKLAWEHVLENIKAKEDQPMKALL